MKLEDYNRNFSLTAHVGNQRRYSNFQELGWYRCKEMTHVTGLKHAPATYVTKLGGWHYRPVACKAVVKGGTKYKYPDGTTWLGDETQGAFGANCVNNDLESINMCNHICNSYAWILSQPVGIAFAIGAL